MFCWRLIVAHLSWASPGGRGGRAVDSSLAGSGFELHPNWLREKNSLYISEEFLNVCCRSFAYRSDLTVDTKSTVFAAR